MLSSDCGTRLVGPSERSFLGKSGGADGFWGNVERFVVPVKADLCIS